MIDDFKSCTLPEHSESCSKSRAANDDELVAFLEGCDFHQELEHVTNAFLGDSGTLMSGVPDDGNLFATSSPYKSPPKDILKLLHEFEFSAEVEPVANASGTATPKNDDVDDLSPTPIDCTCMKIVKYVTLQDSSLLRAPETAKSLYDFFVGELVRHELLDEIPAPATITPSSSPCREQRFAGSSLKRTKMQRISSPVDDSCMDFEADGYKVPDSDSVSATAAKSTTSAQWRDSYDDLCQYHKERGHCNVQHKDSYSLWRWVKRQRYLYKLQEDNHTSRAILSDERIALLERIGFVWDSQATLWMHRLSELEQYCRIYGNCKVPSTFPTNGSLTSWVKCQRRQYKLYCQGVNSNMTKERIEALMNLGFVFMPRDEPRACKKRRSKRL